MTGKVIKKTTDYAIQTGIAESSERLCYQIVNTLYDVIEAETQFLPQAFEYLEQLQSGIDARRDMEADTVKSAVVTPFPH